MSGFNLCATVLGGDKHVRGLGRLRSGGTTSGADIGARVGASR